MDGSRFQVVSPLSHPNYRDLVRGMTKAVWPEFMRHDAVANEHWHQLLDSFPEFQLALYDNAQNRTAGMANGFPLCWDSPLDDLPEGGWDWAFAESIHQHKQGISPNMHCAIQIVIHPDYRGQGLSAPMIEAVRAVTQSRGLRSLIIPLRPSEKSNYPLATLDDYIRWKSDNGLPLDAWLRAHVRLGAKIIKVCHQSKTIRGTRAEWQAWTGLTFRQSGEYYVPGALNPIEIDIEKDEGRYIEPNIWIAHEVN